jgi:hypothetical protein
MTNTRKIVIGMHAGMAGTDNWEFWLVPESMTDDEVLDMAWQCAKDHAEMYGVYPREEYSDTEDFDEDDESYSDNIEGWWEPYVPAEHDGHRVGGDTSWNTY